MTTAGQRDRGVAVPQHKTTAPRIADHRVERPDLVRWATPDPGGIVAVVAPLGYGKTTLSVEVAMASASPVAWLNLDRLDADPRRLWSGLLAALGRAGGLSGAAPAVPAINGPDEQWWDAAAALVEDLGEAEPLLLVLDNLDPDSHAAARAGLDYLIEWLPAQHSLLTTGRRPPTATEPGRLPPQRLRWITSFDLRLEDEESAALLERLLPEAPGRVRRDIVALADGWPAALVLAAGEASASRDPSRPGHVEDTLLDHVLADAPNAASRILMLAAIGPVTTTSAAFFGIENDELRRFVDSGLLLPRQGSTRWWRIPQPLVVAADRRVREGDPDRHRELHAHAGRLAMESNDTESAIEHLLAAGDLPAARAALNRIEDDLFLTGRARDLREWYRRLYGGQDQQNLERHIRAAWSAVFSFDHREAERIVSVLRESMYSPHWSEERVAGEVLVLRSTLAGRRGQLEDMEALGRRAVLSFGDDWSTNSRVLARVLVTRAALWSDNLPALRVAHDELMAQAGLPEYLASGVVMALTAGLALAEGRLRDAVRYGGLSRDWLADHSALATRLPTRDAELTLAAALSESGLEPEAVALLDTVARFGDDHDQPILSVLARLHAARGALLSQRYRDAFELLAEARAVALEVGSSASLFSRLDEVEVPLSLQVGDVKRARAAALRLPPGNQRVMLLAAVQQLRRPGSALRELENLSPVGPRQQVQQELLVARALMTTNRQRAAAHLFHAAAVAEQHGMMFALRTSPAALIEFAAEAAVREADRPLVDLVRFATPAATVEPTLTPGPVVSLTAGERQLLALLPTRLRYDGIAANLGVSINTVKARLKRLYVKLDASSRDEAVAHARVRGFIP